DAEKTRLLEEVASLERAARTARTERDEALEEVATLLNAKNTNIEDKKRSEAQILRMEDELEEMHTALESAEDRYKRSIQQLEQAQADLGIERSAVQLIESQRIALEKQVYLSIILSKHFLKCY
ncbi:unnamed protein product, partial [Protopolystoma xenopodis]